MKTSVILTVSNNSKKNIVQSVVSIIESSIIPDNLCIIFDSTVSNDQWEIGKAFFKGCCGNSAYSEEITDSAIIIKKQDNGTNMTAVKLNKIFSHELDNYGINYLYDETDIFFTMSPGVEFTKNYIEKSLDFYKDPHIGGMYSDYSENGIYQYLPSIHPYLIQNIRVKEVSFRKALIEKNPFKSDKLTLLKEISSRSIIKHIPEALLLA
jgi:hypothetical protein